MGILDNFVLVLLITIYHYFIILIILSRLIKFNKWNTCAATLEEFEVVVKKQTTELDKEVESKAIKALYSYNLNGKCYKNQMIGIFDNFLVFNNYDKFLFYKLQDSFLRKKNIQIFYNPNNNNQSCITKELYSYRFLMLCISAIIFSCVSILSFDGFKSIEMNFVSIFALIVFVILLGVEILIKFTRDF